MYAKYVINVQVMLVEMVELGPLKIQSSMKAVTMLAKTVKINIFRTLDISQKLAIIKGTFL